MAYQINRYDNSLLTTVQDGTINTVTDLKFVGRNFAGYGEIQNENFLFLLENFSGLNPPPKALTGQLWYDSGLQKLKFYDGNQWKTTGGSEVQSTQPTGLAVGDFWWDSANDQLYIFNGANFVLIGPQSAGTGVTQLVSRQVLDTANIPRNIIQAVVNDQVVYIISHDVPFTLGASNPIAGFNVINPGITMADKSLGGVDFKYWGTAENAAQLGGRDAEDFLVAPESGQNLNFTYPITIQNDGGIALGEDFGFKIFVDGASNGIIQNDKGLESEIRFLTTDSAENTIHSVTIDRTGVIPPVNNTYQLGNTTNRWSVVHAESFNGTAERAIQLRVGTNFRSANTGPVANTIAARNSNGDLSAVRFIGDGSQLTNIPAAGTDLAFAGSGNSRTITSSTGASANISTATTSNAGLMSTGDKTKLNGIETGAQVNVGTNLGIIGSGNSRTFTSSTGNNVAIPTATTSNAGFMSTSDKNKLENLPSPSNVVTTSRTLSNGIGITGGGDLSQDRTISVKITGKNAVLMAGQDESNEGYNQRVFGEKSFNRRIVVGDDDMSVSPETTNLTVFGANISAAGYGIGVSTDASSPLKLRRVEGGSGSRPLVRFFRNNTQVGEISSTDTSTTYGTSSDYRLKEKTAEDENFDSNAIVAELSDRLTWYKWISNNQKDFGWIAHELQEICPKAVTGHKDEVDDNGNPVYQQRDDSKLIPILVHALADALKRIEQLENKDN